MLTSVALPRSDLAGLFGSCFVRRATVDAGFAYSRWSTFEFGNGLFAAYHRDGDSIVFFR